tara:strand:- start:485 stop:2617 length:2133 start_codon:yes stop_codon:yes gene_type:complete
MRFGTAGTERLRIDSSGHLKIPDNAQIRIGNVQTGDGDLKLYHNGSNSFIQHLGTGGLYIDALNNSADIAFRSQDNINFYTNAASQSSIACVGNGGVVLYNQGNARFNTDGDGAVVTEKRFAINRNAGDPYLQFQTSGTTHATLYGGSSTGFRVFTGGTQTERLRIDSSGNIKVGGFSHNRDLGGLSVQRLHIEGTDGGSSAIGLVNNQNSSGNAALYLAKSRGSSVNSNTILQNGDPMGSIVWCGADGNDMISQGAAIVAQVDGTPGSNDMPGRLVFKTTADGSATATEKLRITSGGDLKVFATGSGDLGGGASGTAMYLQVSTDVTAPNTPAGGNDSSGMFRIEDRSGNNNRYHGLELRNRNSGDVRILNRDRGSSNYADLIFAVDDGNTFGAGGTIREYMRIKSEGVIEAKTAAGNYYPIASARDGSTSARAATSAWEIKKTLGPRAKTGYYYLKNPYDGSVNTWWCDMTTDGGGWILVAHTGEGQMASLSTSDGNHWYNRSNKGGFDDVGSGYYKGGGYWRASNGAWGENTCGQLMWDVRTHNSEFNNISNDKVVFNWGTDQALPTGNSGYGNIANAGNRRFNEWCYPVENAPGFNPKNYHQNVRSNVLNGQEHFTEHMVMTWSFRNTSGAADDGSAGPYWMIGAHHDGLHQHYEESLSGGDGVYGDGGYQVVSNEDTGWGGGGTYQGYRRIARHSDSGTCNVWLR